MTSFHVASQSESSGSTRSSWPARAHVRHASSGVPDLSLIVPMYNEQDAIDRFVERVVPLLDGLGRTYEVVCVDDGSQDKTLEALLALHEQDKRFKIVALARNFGKEMAVTAGLRHATGRAVSPMDADLQDPPELLQDMLEKWDAGAEVVVAVRRSRPDDSWFQRTTAVGFYRLFNRIASYRLTENAGDYCLLDRRVVDQLNRITEKNRFMKGLFSWIGFRRAYVYFDRPQRVAGTTKWNVWKLWNFALDGITAFSTLPLRIWSYVGTTIAGLAFLYGLFLVLLVLIQGIDVPGYASLMVVILFMGGIQLVTLGILGEYVGRVYTETKGRPEYIVRNVWGLPRPSVIEQKSAPSAFVLKQRTLPERAGP